MSTRGYDVIPVLCEVRNITRSVVEVLGDEPVMQLFLSSVQNLIKIKYQ